MMKKDLIKPNALFLIDGSYLLYRSYYALQPLHTSSGHPTQATYGFCRAIKKIIDDFAPDHIAVIWDSKEKSFRHTLYPTYKANRQSPPNDLFIQKEDILSFLSLIKMTSIAYPGYEADDIIGTITWSNTDSQTVLVCADKDLYQLLNPNTIVVDLFKEEIITEETFTTKQGFPPAKIPFFYALLGDNSDNIPGVDGIGKKSATELVKQFDCLDDLYANIEKIEKKRYIKLLQDQRDNAYLSLQLFTLASVPTTYNPTQFNFDAETWDQAAPFFQKLEFKSLLRTIKNPFISDEKSQEKNTTLPLFNNSSSQWHLHLLTTQDALDLLLTKIKTADLLSLDTETNSLNSLNTELVGLSLCIDDQNAYYLPFNHPCNETEAVLDRSLTLTKLKPHLENSALKKVLHNAKFDYLVLSQYDIHLKGIVFDTLLAANCLKKEWQKINLKDLSFQYLQEPMLTYEQITEKKYSNFSEVPLSLAARYGAHDALQTYKLKNVLERLLDEYPKQKDFFYTVEMPFSLLLQEMEEKGILVNPEQLTHTSNRLTELLLTLQGKFFATLHALNIYQFDEINLNSPKQLEELLFDTLKLPIITKTPQGGRSTDQEVLETLASMHPIPDLLLKYRELSKIKNTYADPLPMYINPKTHRIHSSFSQTIVSTGRLSSNNPNLQNIPASGEFGKSIRSAFIAPAKHLLLSADYSQIELRILAYVTQDPALLLAFQEDRDIHKETASQLFNIPFESVTQEQRQVGKQINFSIMYGLTPFGLSRALKITPKQAKLYIERYFEQYAGVKKWMDELMIQAESTGYVESLWGKRRYIPELQEKNKIRHDAGKRAAINMPIQGTAADLIKIAMINLNKAIKNQHLQATIILQIHDEIIIELPESELLIIEKLTHKEMEQCVQWNVPLKAATRMGKNWGEITK